MPHESPAAVRPRLVKIRRFAKGYAWSVAVLIAFILGLIPAEAGDVRYWVWHRRTALNEEEVRSLKAQAVTTLYWHAVTMRAEGTSWQPGTPLQLPAMREDTIAIVPVVRLDAAGAMPFGSPAVESVVDILREAIRRTGATEAQIDFDCPERRLNEYSTFLAECRTRIAPARLSVTALAGWSRHPAFTKIQDSADALVPMFYDLEPDKPADVRAGRVIPLLDASLLANQLDSWRACRTPWFAGLPDFARVTIFDSSGRSRGHLREWNWDALTFNPALVLDPRSQQAPGVTLLKAEKNTVLERTPVSEGETVACRLTDLAHLGQAIEYAKIAGASGVTLFRLPGEGSQGGWSLQQLQALVQQRSVSSPAFKVRRIRSGLELANESGADLPPRLVGAGGPHDRGWQLEVESGDGAIFREASPGEFANVYSHAEPDSREPKLVPVSLAQRLTYWFSDLRAGTSRQTGLLQLAPGAATASLKWRIVGSDQNSEWQPVE